MRNTRKPLLAYYYYYYYYSVFKLYSEITQCSSERQFRINLSLRLCILRMSFSMRLMYWMYSAMLWRKSHMSQLLREAQAFMMKWHFADIKIGQFVPDVLECSCWDAVSYQDENVFLFFFPLSDPGSKQQEKGRGCTTFSFIAHFYVLLLTPSCALQD